MFNTTNERHQKLLERTEWHMDFLVGSTSREVRRRAHRLPAPGPHRRQRGPCSVKRTSSSRRSASSPSEASGPVLRPRSVRGRHPEGLGKDLNLIAKYLFDVEHRNLFKQRLSDVSAVLKF